MSFANSSWGSGHDVLYLTVLDYTCCNIVHSIIFAMAVDNQQGNQQLGTTIFQPIFTHFRTYLM